ncbi:hypothetical protein [Sphaerochaeta sp. PS]|uniref:hypothetical protein n=1 Tax=Sphaerochaeta sp. PS TaxID=3076336 RepID=UPI0028A3196D|nr:hypothetical protein [Sphaerochaeta sp. PS]MDT4761841.1 hypothetical protein [Sphaerochaeta sp. PS]
MITIIALDHLQQSAPETRMVSLNTPFSGFCSVAIEPPEAITEYFKEFLAKANALTSGSECRVKLSSDGSLFINLILPDRRYQIIPDASKPIYRINEIQQISTKHQEIIRDAAGHEKMIWVCDKIKFPQEE